MKDQISEKPPSYLSAMRIRRRQELGGDEEVEDEGLRDGEKSNDTRKGSIFGAETGSGVVPFSSSSDQVGRWCEGEKAFPLKKRRGSFERGGGVVPMNQETIMEKEKKMKTKMKTKMNKKCVQENDDEEHGSERETKQGFDSSTTTTTAAASSAKKRSRGGALMEGSRCSRVNGRGWRCCQQTLVGYSLCEHHLGKGRLRSMSSVRSRAIARNQTQELFNPLSQLPQKNQEQEHPLQEDRADVADDEKPFTGGAKKRVKIGMVKARSLSSLLGQPSSAVAVAADDNK